MISSYFLDCPAAFSHDAPPAPRVLQKDPGCATSGARNKVRTAADGPRSGSAIIRDIRVIRRPFTSFTPQHEVRRRVKGSGTFFGRGLLEVDALLAEK